MLSRVAENLYWISRYVERVESVARLLNDSLQLELDAAGLRPRTERTAGRSRASLTILGCREAASAAPPRGRPGGRPPLPDLRGRPPRLDRSGCSPRPRERQGDPGDPQRRGLGADQPPLSLPWRQDRRAGGIRSSPSRFFEGVKRACILFAGLVDATLPRNEVYHFLQPRPLPGAGDAALPDPRREGPGAAERSSRWRPGRSGSYTARASCSAARPTTPTSARPTSGSTRRARSAT